MLFRELGASLLGSILPGKGVIRACEQALRAEKYLMSPHLLSILKIQRHNPKEHQFNLLSAADA